MGEVYRAADTRLGRDVAIKVLPPHIATDPQLKQRFEIEARTLAALSHPHICSIFDVGLEASTDSESVAFLVMEYLEGETLAERLARGALPLDQALRFGVQIADALDKAHRQGVVHRDLKPGNVMVTKAGVKLLDFGLAKLQPAAAAAGISGAETARPLTARGTILGTLNYMAPEQVEGAEADARADLFALGAVLYEMITGKRAFDGKSQPIVMASILEHQPPPIRSLQPITPPLLEHLVLRCLAKDPDERWQSAGDVMRELRWIADNAVTADARSGARPRDRRVVWLVAVATVGVFAVAAALALRPAPAPAVWKLDVATPPTDQAASFAISPDGRQLAFVARDGASARTLWVRRLDRDTAQALAGTDGATFPFWSPDGRALGFFSGGRLKRIDLTGGMPQDLAPAPPLGLGATWKEDGTIVFSQNQTLGQVNAFGGPVSPVTEVLTGQTSQRWPHSLPDGGLLYFIQSGVPDSQGVFFVKLGATPTRVLDGAAAARFVPPDWLLVVRQGVLSAFRFDPQRGVISGDPLPIAQGVNVFQNLGVFSVSPAGVLAYRLGNARQTRQLTWVDRAGKVLGVVGQSNDDATPANPEISPDSLRVAVNRVVQNNNDIWIIDVARNVMSRFTFEPHTQGAALWSPDGLQMVFGSSPKGLVHLHAKPATGAGAEKLLGGRAQTESPLDWSPDGKLVLYAAGSLETGVDLLVLPANGGEPTAVVQSPYDDFNGQFSPDGRWIAYQSNEGGRNDIYVVPFPATGAKSQISSNGGVAPRWRGDGRELFYLALDGRMTAVPITTDGGSVQAGTPVALFPTRLASGGNIGTLALTKPQYAVARDGRFLLNAVIDEGAAPPITVVVNWEQALKSSR